MYSSIFLSVKQLNKCYLNVKSRVICSPNPCSEVPDECVIFNHFTRSFIKARWLRLPPLSKHAVGSKRPFSRRLSQKRPLKTARVCPLVTGEQEWYFSNPVPRVYYLRRNRKHTFWKTRQFLKGKTMLMNSVLWKIAYIFLLLLAALNGPKGSFVHYFDFRYGLKGFLEMLLTLFALNTIKNRRDNWLDCLKQKVTYSTVENYVALI